MRRATLTGVSTCIVLSAGAASAATRSVGPGKTYAKPCAAFAAASDGDTIQIDASGSYDGDVCAITRNNLVITGVGGLAHIDAAGQSSGGKAIWVIQGNNTTVKYIEFSGATVVDQNGAGIRQEGTNLTVSHCSFHDNEDGILAGDDANSTITIEYTEFNHNGYGDGLSHNLYINHVKKFVFQYNWSHRAKVGHLLKSRAAETDVLYNRLTGESDGTESYEIDIPNGGKAYVIGNLVEQGAQTGNSTMLAYQEEGTNAANPDHELFVVNNTFVNDRGSGTFVNVGGSVTTPAVIKNNIFQGGGTITNQGSATQANNESGGTTCLVNAASFDYHLVAGSPCVDAGANPGSGGGMSLTPTYQYVQPTAREGRTTVGTIDIGAYELGGGTAGSGGAGGAGTGGAAGSGTGGSGTGGAATGGSGGAGTGGASTGGTGGSAGNTGGSAGNAAAGASGNGSTSNSKGGCGCRAAGHDTNRAPLWFASISLLGLALRRRR